MCVRVKPVCYQVLLCFSRDTAVLDHFKYNSATPPKSYIQGETTSKHNMHPIITEECHFTDRQTVTMVS